MIWEPPFERIIGQVNDLDSWSFLQLEREDKRLRFPSKLFNESSSLYRAGMFPSVGGTEPEKLFSNRDSSYNSEKFPRKLGIRPVS
jgi:hypothetical protein